MNLKGVYNIDDLMYSPNIATDIDKHDLDTIGHQVVEDYTSDLMSRSAWERRTEQSLKLALQVVENKNFPWPNASNVKFPLVTIAALQYHARSYPVLVDGSTPIKCRVIGEDNDGSRTADRKSTRLNSSHT